MSLLFCNFRLLKQNLKITLDTEHPTSVDTLQTNSNNNVTTDYSLVHSNDSSTSTNNIFRTTNKNLTSKLHSLQYHVDDNENLSLRIYFLLLVYGICAAIYSGM